MDCHTPFVIGVVFILFSLAVSITHSTSKCIGSSSIKRYEHKLKHPGVQICPQCIIITPPPPPPPRSDLHALHSSICLFFMSATSSVKGDPAFQGRLEGCVPPSDPSEGLRYTCGGPSSYRFPPSCIFDRLTLNSIVNFSAERRLKLPRLRNQVSPALVYPDYISIFQCNCMHALFSQGPEK